VRIVSTHDSTSAIQNIHSSSTNSLSTGTIGLPSSLCFPAKAGAFCLALGDLPLAPFNGIAQERCCTADRLLYEPAQYSTAPHAPPRSRSTKCSVDSFCML
jgi:hypothetical protein